MAAGAPAGLSPLQKQQLYDDGFLVLRQAVAPALIAAAKAKLVAAGDHKYQDEALETSAEFTAL